MRSENEDGGRKNGFQKYLKIFSSLYSWLLGRLRQKDHLGPEVQPTQATKQDPVSKKKINF
jgi:hypothetical protein